MAEADRSLEAAWKAIEEIQADQRRFAEALTRLVAVIEKWAAESRMVPGGAAEARAEATPESDNSLEDKGAVDRLVERARGA